MKTLEPTRKQQRETIVKKLYEMDITNDLGVFTHSTPYIEASVNGVVEHLSKIDQLIIDNLVNWKINRLTYIDRAIIRFAVYEIYYTDTPFEIVVNEALNITRKYSDEGDDKMVGFINRVLQNIKNSIK